LSFSPFLPLAHRLCRLVTGGSFWHFFAREQDIFSWTAGAAFSSLFTIVRYFATVYSQSVHKCIMNLVALLSCYFYADMLQFS
jgi:hypothetical protein